MAIEYCQSIVVAQGQKDKTRCERVARSSPLDSSVFSTREIPSGDNLPTIFSQDTTVSNSPYDAYIYIQVKLVCTQMPCVYMH